MGKYYCREGADYERRDEYKKYMDMSQEERDRLFAENLKKDMENPFDFDDPDDEG